jgi:hypothetical protein
MSQDKKSLEQIGLPQFYFLLKRVAAGKLFLHYFAFGA